MNLKKSLKVKVIEIKLKLVSKFNTFSQCFYKVINKYKTN